MLNKIINRFNNNQEFKFKLNNDQINLIKRLIDDYTNLVNVPTRDIHLDLNEKRKDLILLWQIYAGVLENQTKCKTDV